MKKDNNQKLSVLWSLLCLFFFVILFNSCYNNEDDPVYENLKELVVSNTAVNLEYGDSTTVTISQGNGGYEAVAEDNSIAEVSVISTTVKIKALKSGSTYITVRDQKGKTQNIVVTIAAPVNIETNEFITVWKTDNEGTSNSTSVTLPVSGSYIVKWEEVGKSSHKGQEEYSDITPANYPTIDFGSVGMYRVRITAKDAEKPFGFIFDTYSAPALDGLKLIRVERWGVNKWPSAASMFAQCRNMDVTATDVPDFSACDGKMYNMFYHCENLVGNTSFAEWNVSMMWHMNELFAYCYKFNQNINAWNTKGGYLMSAIFKGCTVFNQPLDNWNLKNAANLSGFFENATSFNQDISSWELPNAENLSYMFNHATAFNRSLGSWTLEKVTNMEEMLTNCGMKSKNYDATLKGWAENAKTPNNMKLGANSLVYSSAGKDAHKILTDTKGWTITGDSYNASGN